MVSHTPPTCVCVCDAQLPGLYSTQACKAQLDTRLHEYGKILIYAVLSALCPNSLSQREREREGEECCVYTLDTVGPRYPYEHTELVLLCVCVPL